MSLGLSFGYGKSLDFGLDISGGVSMGMSLSYSIGDAKVIDLSALGMAVSMTFEYYRSKDIGFSLSSYDTTRFRDDDC